MTITRRSIVSWFRRRRRRHRRNTGTNVGGCRFNQGNGFVETGPKEVRGGRRNSVQQQFDLPLVVGSHKKIVLGRQGQTQRNRHRIVPTNDIVVVVVLGGPATRSILCSGCLYGGGYDSGTITSGSYGTAAGHVSW